jgi:type II secretory pathway pseudopilin PulG
MNAPETSTSSRRTAAFTLLELVVVIAIIIILIGLLAIGLVGARGQALHKATRARIAQLEVAAQQFHGAFRVYPPDEWGDKTDNPPAAGTMMEFLVNHGYDSNGNGDMDDEITTEADSEYQDIECLVYAVSIVRPFLELKRASRSNKESTPDEIDWQDADTMNSPAYEICDAWGNPLHYDSSPTHNADFVDIWSNGPDGVDDSGDNDDINNWERD